MVSSPNLAKLYSKVDDQWIRGWDVSGRPPKGQHGAAPRRQVAAGNNVLSAPIVIDSDADSSSQHSSDDPPSSQHIEQDTAGQDEIDDLFNDADAGKGNSNKGGGSELDVGYGVVESSQEPSASQPRAPIAQMIPRPGAANLPLPAGIPSLPQKYTPTSAAHHANPSTNTPNGPSAFASLSQEVRRLSTTPGLFVPQETPPPPPSTAPAKANIFRLKPREVALPKPSNPPAQSTPKEPISTAKTVPKGQGSTSKNTQKEQAPALHNALKELQSTVPKKRTSRISNDPKAGQDIPSWLDSIGMAHFTDNFKNLAWPELVKLDNEGLKKLGITPYKARGKMLKVFERLKEDQAEPPTSKVKLSHPGPTFQPQALETSQEITALVKERDNAIQMLSAMQNPTFRQKQQAKIDMLEYNLRRKKAKIVTQDDDDAFDQEMLRQLEGTSQVGPSKTVDASEAPDLAHAKMGARVEALREAGDAPSATPKKKSKLFGRSLDERQVKTPKNEALDKVVVVNTSTNTERKTMPQQNAQLETAIPAATTSDAETSLSTIHVHADAEEPIAESGQKDEEDVRMREASSPLFPPESPQPEVNDEGDVMPSIETASEPQIPHPDELVLERDAEVETEPTETDRAVVEEKDPNIPSTPSETSATKKTNLFNRTETEHTSHPTTSIPLPLPHPLTSVPQPIALPPAYALPPPTDESIWLNIITFLPPSPPTSTSSTQPSTPHTLNSIRLRTTSSLHRLWAVFSALYGVDEARLCFIVENGGEEVVLRPEMRVFSTTALGDGGFVELYVLGVEGEVGEVEGEVRERVREGEVRWDGASRLG